MSPQLFTDNLAFFNPEVVRDQLANLWIAYNKESKGNINGEYYGRHLETNRYGIIIYNATCFADCNKGVLHHEFCHSLTDLQNYGVYSYGNAAYELLNVLYSNEYFGSINGNFPHTLYDQGYPWHQNSQYLLAELLNQDTLKEFHATFNPQIVINDLLEIIPDEAKALKLLTNIDIINSANFSFDEDLFSEKNRELFSLIKATEKENNQIFKEYFEIKFGKSIEDQPNILYWLDKDLFYDYIANNYTISDEAKKFLPNYTGVSTYKIYLYNLDNNEFMIRYCQEVEKNIENYTLEQLLNGESGEKFKSIDEIPYEKTPDGTYEIIWISPKTYVNVSVESNLFDQNMTK